MANGTWGQLFIVYPKFHDNAECTVFILLFGGIWEFNLTTELINIKVWNFWYLSMYVREHIKFSYLQLKMKDINVRKTAWLYNIGIYWVTLHWWFIIQKFQNNVVYKINYSQILSELDLISFMKVLCTYTWWIIFQHGFAHL